MATPAALRISAAVRRLLDADRPLPAAALAAEAGLPESRFLRLFRAGPAPPTGG